MEAVWSHLVAFGLGMLLGTFVMDQIKKLKDKND